MAGMRILQVEDLDIIRTTCLPLLPPERSVFFIPDEMLVGVTFVPRAEFMVIRRIGLDWIKIKAGLAPVTYAGGDPTFAQQLLTDAIVMYTCYYLVPSLRLIIAKQEDNEVIKIARETEWGKVQTEYLMRAKASMGLLKPLKKVASALQMARPPFQPSDPDAIDNLTTIRPLFHGRVDSSDGTI